jgi:alkylation response protein AidB-like acyl-CoA dehydrogenase
MDFSFSEEQNLLRNSLSRYLADNYSYAAWRKFIRAPEGRDPAHWAQFTELGLLAAALPEEFGGFGGGAVETMLVMEEFGKRLVVEPFVPTAVIAPALLLGGGSQDQKNQWLARIAAGETVMAFAFAEPQGRFNLADLTTSAKKIGNGYVLGGKKIAVIGAPFADTLIVTARTGGVQRARDGVGVFLVDKAAKGITTRDYPTIDGNRTSDILFENVAVPEERRIGGEALTLIERAVDAAIAAHAAEAVGAMRMLLDATVAYAKTRQQFGVAIGKFQVLQHRMVDMAIAVEQATSLALMAALRGDPRSISAAKAGIGPAARTVGQSAIQIHGGMGMTDELDVGHYFKRLTALEMLYGGADHHLRRMAALDSQPIPVQA